MITIATPTLSAVFLAAIRIGVVLIFTPIQAIRQLPTSLRLILVLMISIFLVSHLSLTVGDSNETTLVAKALVELVNGLILSLSLYAAFAIFQITGQLIECQMGLNSLAIFNPSEHSQDPLTSRLLTMFAVLFFFSLDGHHRLIQGLAYSLTIIPLGKLTLFQHFNLLINQFKLVFIFSWMIASPILIGLILVELCAAIITRNMPQINTYFLALPIKILFGFFLLRLVLNHINPLMEHIFNLCFQTWDEVLS